MVLKKYIIPILIIVGLIIAYGAFFWSYRNNIFNLGKTSEAETQKETPKKILIEDIKITDKTKPFDIDITYPKLLVGEADKFNKKVENIVIEELSSFKEIALENDEFFKKIDLETPREYYLQIDYTTGEVNENISSIVLNIQHYTGGAHGAHYSKSVNFDIKNNKEVDLAQIFDNQSNYLQIVSDFCTKELDRQISERSEGYGVGWIQDGAGPLKENFSVFLINKDNITFYFPEYQVAPYALGSFQVVMPRP